MAAKCTLVEMHVLILSVMQYSNFCILNPRACAVMSCEGLEMTKEEIAETRTLHTNICSKILVIILSLGTLCICCGVLCVTVVLIFVGIPMGISLTHHFIRYYHTCLSVLMLIWGTSSFYYLWYQRKTERRPPGQHQVSQTMQRMAVILECLIEAGYIYGFIFIIIFWSCDETLQATKTYEKALDMFSCCATVIYVIGNGLYQYQTSNLKPPSNMNSWLEILLNTGNTCILFLFLTFLLCNKIYHGAHSLHLAHPDNDTIQELYQGTYCHLSKSQEAWLTVHRLVLVDNFYVIATEAVPVLLIIHWIVRDASSHIHQQQITQLSTINFRKGWLVMKRKWIRGLFTVLNVIGATALLVSRVAFKTDIESSNLNIPWVDGIGLLASLLASIHHGSLFMSHFGRGKVIKMAVFHRIVLLFNRIFLRKRTSTKYIRMTHHARFDIRLMAICLIFCFFIALERCGHEPKNIIRWISLVTKIVAYGTEFSNVSVFITRNRTELNQKPLGHFAVGPMISLFGALDNLVSFLDVSLARYMFKTHEHPETNGLLPQEKVWEAIEPVYFAVSMFHFTAGLGWYGLAEHYFDSGAYLIGKETIEESEYKKYVNQQEKKTNLFRDNLERFYQLRTNAITHLHKHEQEAKKVNEVSSAQLDFLRNIYETRCDAQKLLSPFKDSDLNSLRELVSGIKRNSRLEQEIENIVNMASDMIQKTTTPLIVGLRNVQVTEENKMEIRKFMKCLQRLRHNWIFQNDADLLTILTEFPRLLDPIECLIDDFNYRAKTDVDVEEVWRTNSIHIIKYGLLMKNRIKSLLALFGNTKLTSHKILNQFSSEQKCTLALIILPHLFSLDCQCTADAGHPIPKHFIQVVAMSQTKIVPKCPYLVIVNELLSKEAKIHVVLPSVQRNPQSCDEVFGCNSVSVCFMDAAKALHYLLAAFSTFHIPYPPCLTQMYRFIECYCGIDTQTDVTPPQLIQLVQEIKLLAIDKQ